MTKQPSSVPAGPASPPVSESDPGIRVTVVDLKTGDTDSVVIHDDYVVTCAGSCYVEHTQVYRNGTHQLTVKGRR